jgi:hypothetical protein
VNSHHGSNLIRKQRKASANGAFRLVRSWPDSLIIDVIDDALGVRIRERTNKTPIKASLRVCYLDPLYLLTHT